MPFCRRGDITTVGNVPRLEAETDLWSISDGFQVARLKVVNCYPQVQVLTCNPVLCTWRLLFQMLVSSVSIDDNGDGVSVSIRVRVEEGAGPIAG